MSPAIVGQMTISFSCVSDNPQIVKPGLGFLLGRCHPLVISRDWEWLLVPYSVNASHFTSEIDAIISMIYMLLLGLGNIVFCYPGGHTTIKTEGVS